ncbi:sensor histidine kinase [Raoultibacter phocaeensis]|uniref:sensor histidine kinase n=1 Tax=Raoultibacter phocaeensis TaxID=2479841 RepID=UPI001118A154|nr:sensor histidine kinase [Raoultibacter phocaeensis]
MEDFLINTKKMGAADWLLDVAIALGAFAFGCAQLLLTMSSVVMPDELFRQLLGIPNVMPQVGAYVAIALTTLPLVARRKSPWLVFVFVMIAFLGTQNTLTGYTLAILGPIIALYTIAHERDRAEAVVATVLAVASLLFVTLPTQSESLSDLMRLQNVTYMVAAALGGFAVRTHQEYVAETEQRAFAAEKSREEEAARRVEEERVRIAREIHDITAHSLSAVSIQAAAAERMIDRDPEAAKQTIATVRATSKDALEEIRSMIGVLRSGDAQAETVPTVGTERMADIVSYLEDAGIDVDYDATGFDRERVPAYIDVALFGIAREAATNIVRHADAHRVSIRLATDGEMARLAVEDDGRGRTEGEKTDGHGIEGMNERVNLLDGTISAHNRAGKGFAVRVSIPLGEAGRNHG